MHGKHLFVLPALFLTALLLLPACSGDDDPSSPTNLGDPPEFDPTVALDYDVPADMRASANPKAQEIVGYLDRMGWLTMRLARLEPPSGKVAATEKGGPWVYHWTEGDPGYDELNFTLTIRELTDRYTWELRSDGTRYEVDYDDYLNLAAQIAKDGSWGWLEEYDAFGSGDRQFRWSWQISGTTVTRTIDVHDPFSPYRIVMVANQDGSGNLNYYRGVPDLGWLWLAADWDATGAGTWTEYDEGGGVVDSGTWVIPPTR